MKAVVQKWGNSLGIRIPATFARALKLADGETVDVRMDQEQLVIQPTGKETLHAKLKRISSDNLHPEISSDGPRGTEAW